MPQEQAVKVILALFASKIVVDLPAIQEVLGDVSAMTVYRHLRQVPYRRSYDHNGRYYTFHDTSRYDKAGLWSRSDIHFSVDGSLKSTVRRIVREETAGATHRELREMLRVRLHNTLLDLLRRGDVGRERITNAYVYVHSDSAVRCNQLERRRERMALEMASSAGAEGVTEVTDRIVIEVLLVLIRHPRSSPADVVRYLQGQSPPVAYEQVRAVFARYDLGKKRGPSNC